MPNCQRASWFAGLGLIGIALLSPLATLGETDLLSAHMAQHLLIGDLSAPLLVIGARWPVYAFLLPSARDACRSRARTPPQRRLRTVTLPLVGCATSVLTSYLWHFAVALRRGAFATRFCTPSSTRPSSPPRCWCGSSVLEPTKRRVPGGAWKIAHVGGARLAGMFLGMAFIFARAPVATRGFYGGAGAETRHHRR